jgi:hypothetical protein
LHTIDLTNRVSDYHLTPSLDTFHSEKIIKNALAIGDLPIKFAIKSRWFDLERIIEQRGNDLYIKETTAYKQRVILKSDMAGEEFREMRRILRRDFGSYTVIYNFAEPLAEVYHDDSSCCEGLAH